jgi:hypothetical protein
MNKTLFEIYFEKGDEHGRRRAIRGLLQARFGPSPAPARERLEQWPPERLEPLEPLLTAILKARSLKEVGPED